jgi:hypothetical protein
MKKQLQQLYLQIEGILESASEKKPDDEKVLTQGGLASE